MKRILFFAVTFLFVSLFSRAVPIPAADPAPKEKPLQRIAFGSCAHQDKPQPIWEAVIASKPDVFIFAGDNIYADTEDMAVMKATYDKLAAIPGYQKLLKACPVIATWDDHDYGANDAGAEYPKKVESQKLFLDFFKEPEDSPRRKRPGVYDAKLFGPEAKRVQIILLDTRYFRDPLKKNKKTGAYEPITDASSTMLGADQWKWLEEQLRIPARVRVIVSSIQVVAEDDPWEKWANMPLERVRLYKLIADAKASGVFFISGDRHLAELSMMDGGVGYPLYDLTSSGLNQSSKKWGKYDISRHRVSTMNWGDNFGLITIDWDRPDPRISLQIRDDEGDINIQRKINLSTLQPGVIKK